jgi:hypothetical protein
MKVTERRLVEQSWYETEYSKTGWDSHGWHFKDSGWLMYEIEWTIVEHLDYDKFYNPILAIAEKETEI